MSHTNSTPNYGLPQYVGTDIINPLVDTNGAYSDIDTALHNIADAEATDAGKITALETAVGDSSSGLVKKVADLEGQNGDSVLTTTAQTLSGAVNELDSAIGTANTNIGTNAGNITGLQQKVGSDTLTTTAQTCTGAINELDGDVALLGTNKADKSGIPTGYVFDDKYNISVDTDGVKTYAQLLDELKTAVQATIDNLGTSLLAVDVLEIAGYGTITTFASTYLFDSTSTAAVDGYKMDVLTSGVDFWRARLSTSSILYAGTLDGSTPFAITDRSSSVPAAGGRLRLRCAKYLKQTV